MNSQRILRFRRSQSADPLLGFSHGPRGGARSNSSPPIPGVPMRKIETAMIVAIRDCFADRHFSGEMLNQGNTIVRQIHEPGPNGARRVEVLLYGNLIAILEPSCYRISLYSPELTATTKNRMNAILANLSDGWRIVQRASNWRMIRNSWSPGSYDPFHDGICVGIRL